MPDVPTGDARDTGHSDVGESPGAERKLLAKIPLSGDILTEDLDDLIEIVREVDDPEKARSVLSLTMASMSMSWSGPLPHPAALAAYNDAFPGCAKEIVQMAQTQAEHRQELEKLVIKADISLRQKGQYFGFVIAMSVIIGGVILAWSGKSLAGLSSIVIGVAGLVGLFIYSRKEQGQDLAEKRELLAESLAQHDAEDR